MNANTECNAEGCHRCAATKGDVKGVVMHRIAPKGEIGPWACPEHVAAERAAWQAAK